MSTQVSSDLGLKVIASTYRPLKFLKSTLKLRPTKTNFNQLQHINYSSKIASNPFLHSQLLLQWCCDTNKCLQRNVSSKTYNGYKNSSVLLDLVQIQPISHIGTSTTYEGMNHIFMDTYYVKKLFQHSHI